MKVAKKHTFEEARKHLPCEKQRKLEKRIDANRQKLISLMINEAEQEQVEQDIIDDEKELERLGGNTREQLIRVLTKYKPESDSRWFVEAFDEIEREIFNRILFGEKDFEGILDRFGDADGYSLSINELIVDDRGMGSGRTLRMLMDLVKDHYGQPMAQYFAKNLYGLDLMPQNLIDADRRFKDGRYGFPTNSNISEGSFLDPSSERTDDFGVKKMKAHLITCMMHSSFYNVTQEDWEMFFRNIHDDLETGGLFVMDTIAMPNFEPDQIQQMKPSLGNLRDLYTRLWLKHCDVNQRNVPKGINLQQMPRYQIYDNTTGVGFYNREVPTPPFIQYIIDQIGGGMQIERMDTETPRFSSKEEAAKLGYKWIKENGFLDEYREKIKKWWIKDKVLDPSIILGAPITTQSEGGIRRVVHKMIMEVALSLAWDYRNTYLYIRRTD